MSLIRLPIVLLSLMTVVVLSAWRLNGPIDSGSGVTPKDASRLTLRKGSVPHGSAVTAVDRSEPHSRADASAANVIVAFADAEAAAGGPADADERASNADGPLAASRIDHSTASPTPPRESATSLEPRRTRLSVQKKTPTPAAMSPTWRQRTHRIVDGDTLPDIAQRYLGDAQRHLEIFETNRDVLQRPDLLPLHVTIKIPPR